MIWKNGEKNSVQLNKSNNIVNYHNLSKICATKGGLKTFCNGKLTKLTSFPADFNAFTATQCSTETVLIPFTMVIMSPTCMCPSSYAAPPGMIFVIYI